MPDLFVPWNTACSLVFGLGFTSFLVGCGHEPRSHVQRVDVSATVTSGGAPLAGALIDLSNAENGEAYGGTLDDAGQVHLQGIAVGNYTITVQPPPGDPLPDAPQTARANAMQIPAQFRNPQASPLQASISKEERTFLYDLKDAASPAKR